MNGFEKPHERIIGHTDAGQSWEGEEIIRCRDCERWSNEPPNYREEPQWCGRFACHAEPDGFCKWAKRKDMEGNR